MAGAGIQIQVSLTPNPELSSQYRFAMPSSPGNNLQLHRHTNLLSGSACIQVFCLCSYSQHPPSITLQQRFVSHFQLQSEALEPTSVYLFHLQPQQGNREAQSFSQILILWMYGGQMMLGCENPQTVWGEIYKWREFVPHLLFWGQEISMSFWTWFPMTKWWLRRYLYG